MKILLVSGSPLEKWRGDYYAVDPWIRFPIQLANHFERLTLWAPVISREDANTLTPGCWKVDFGNLKIVPNDYYYTFVGYYKLWPRRFPVWKSVAADLIENHDIVMLRLMSPMAGMISRLAIKKAKPFIAFITGDVEAQSDRILGSRGLKKWMYQKLVKFWIRQEKLCCRRASRVYVYSQELAARHSAVRERIRLFRTPHLSVKDIYDRPDTCQGDEIRLLRVCWLLPSKGLETLLESMKLLLERGYPVTLRLVGKERVAGYQKSLEALAERLRIRDRIHFEGWAPFDRIHSIYTASDLQVISSLAEGTPRVILEGAARGLPLVCTKVGGCQERLSHEEDALLVPPRDAQAMADAVERLIRDTALRQKLIRRGYEIVRANTFEHLGMGVVRDIKSIGLGQNVDPESCRQADSLCV